jgi:hypothetical protein
MKNMHMSKKNIYIHIYKYIIYVIAQRINNRMSPVERSVIDVDSTKGGRIETGRPVDI